MLSLIAVDRDHCLGRDGALVGLRGKLGLSMSKSNEAFASWISDPFNEPPKAGPSDPFNDPEREPSDPFNEPGPEPSDPFNEPEPELGKR